MWRASRWRRPARRSGAQVASRSALTILIGSSTQNGSNSRQGPHDPLGAVRSPQRMQLRHDVHPAADRGAYLAERRHRLVQLRGRDGAALGRLGSKVEGPDLHRRDALLQQGVRELIGAVEEGVQVLIGAAGRRGIDAPVRRSAARRRRVCSDSRRRCCRYGCGRATGRPGTGANRLARRLAEQVPQRDVHGRGGAHLHPAAREAEIAVLQACGHAGRSAAPACRAGAAPRSRGCGPRPRAGPKNVSPRPVRPSSVWTCSQSRFGNSPSRIVSMAVIFTVRPSPRWSAAVIVAP